MASTFTPNLNLEKPGRGDQVGVWDTPVNSNENVIDLVAGGIATIGLNNANVVLSAAQFQAGNVTFNSTLTGNVNVTFPTSFTKPYIIGNFCTGSSAFTITLATTAAGGQVICCPPGEFIDVINDGTNIKFKNLGRVGSLMDWGGSSVPAWISGCTVAPYLNCDGTTFSSATFPQLAVMLAGTTLPDIRGTNRYTLNQGTGRLTTALGGLDGNTNLSLKTTQVTLGTSNLPPYTPAGSIAGTVPIASPTGYNNTFVGGAQNIAVVGAGNTALSGTFTGTAQGGASNVLPVGSATVVGLTLIRSA